jgi:hypothetical protein
VDDLIKRILTLGDDGGEFLEKGLHNDQ